MHDSILRSALVLVLAVAVGCGGSSNGGTPGTDTGAPAGGSAANGTGAGGTGTGTDGTGAGGGTTALPTPLGSPMTGLVAGQWSWVPFPDAFCGDGSATGIGVNPGTGTDLVLFLDGGGACSSGATCFGFPALGIPRTATTLGPFGENEFDARIGSALPGSILDRTLAGSPFATATQVFIPYCTGDVHGGTKVVTYADLASGTVQHVGHANLLAYLKRIAATYASPTRLVVTGSSAGGFGTIVNYPNIRAYYAAAQGVALDDSGPLLENDGGVLIQGGFTNWGVGEVLSTVCGASLCKVKLSDGMVGLMNAYPQDRFALLSYDVDDVINAFYFTSLAGVPAPATTFAPALRKMLTDVFDPAPNGRYFVAAAPTASGKHVLLVSAPGSISQSGVSLVSWIAQVVTGTAPPASVKP